MARGKHFLELRLVRQGGSFYYNFLYYISKKMFRAIPMSNKLCFDKDVKRSWKIHEAKLQSLKSHVGKERPQKFQFLDQRPKKVALQEVRNLEIDRENQSLMKKIKAIQSKGCKTSYANLYQDLSESKKRTLNQPYRKRELLKIVEENQQILKRLQQKRSAISIRKMDHERRQIEKNISLISEFPYKNYPQSRTPTNLWSTLDNFERRSPPPQELDFSYRGQQEVDGTRFTITTYLSKGNFYLEMENIQERSQRYRIQLPQQKARDLLRISYKGRIQKMLQNLSVDKAKQICFLRYAPANDV